MSEKEIYMSEKEICMNEEIYDKLQSEYPIIELNKYHQDHIEYNISNYSIDFNNYNMILTNNEFVKYLNYLLKCVFNEKKKIMKAIYSIIIFHIVFSNKIFLKTNEKFKLTVYNKLLEFKNDDLDELVKLKVLTNDQNVVDICLNIYNKMENKNNLNWSINQFVEKTFENLIDINEIIKNHPILLENEDSKFNFKVKNNYDIDRFNHYIYTLSKSNKNQQIILLTIYEIFINNINLVLKNTELKIKIKLDLKNILIYDLQKFDKYKIYNNNVNPLITISRLINFYFE